MIKVKALYEPITKPDKIGVGSFISHEGKGCAVFIVAEVAGRTNTLALVKLTTGCINGKAVHVIFQDKLLQEEAEVLLGSSYNAFMVLTREEAFDRVRGVE